MDSGSDWDSLSDDDQLKTKSQISVPQKKLSIKNSPQKLKTNISNQQLQQSHQQDRHKTTVPDQKKTTVFTDRDYTYNGVDNGGFQSVELQDKRYLEKRSINQKKRKTKWVPDNNQNLPYTTFKAENEDKSPNKHIELNLIPQNQYVVKKDDDNSWDEDNSDDDTEKDVQNTDSEYIKPKSFVKNSYKETRKVGNGTSIVHISTCKDHGKDHGKVVPNQNYEERFYYEKTSYGYHTIHVENTAVIPDLADSLEIHMRRGWQEFFGILRIIFNFFVIFLLELISFVLVTIFQKPIVGVIKLIGDHLFKPLFSSIFNYLLQPMFVLLFNCFTGIRQLLRPVFIIINDIVTPLVVLLKSFRLFEYKHSNSVKSI